jgi:RNA polymerase-binding transcription factor DksA
MAKKVQKAKKAAPKKAVKPVKKANASKKPAKLLKKPAKPAAKAKSAKPVKKSVVKSAAKKPVAKPVAKKAVKKAPAKPVKKAAKPIAKKAVKAVAGKSKIAKKVLLKPAKKAAPAKAVKKPVKPVKPVKSVKKAAPVKKAMPAKPVAKTVAKPVAKSTPAKGKSTIEKVIEKGKQLVKNIIDPKASSKKETPKAATPDRGTVVEKKSPSVATKTTVESKPTTVTSIQKSKGDQEDMRKADKPGERGEKETSKATPVKRDPNEKTRYSDAELQEFRELIMKKLDEAHRDYELLKDTLSHRDNNGTDDTSPTFKLLEDGSDVLSKEETAQLAARQQKFIQALENALIRIENKTYGICRATGKLISKERLRSVPHATLSIEAKMEQS